MRDCCGTYGDTASGQFGAAVARRDLDAYRRRGPDRVTRLMRDAVIGAAGDSRPATVLDIGGGIGALSLELIAAGVGQATVVDASRPYLEAARAEARRTGREDRLTIVPGDFVELAPTLAAADVVAMNRVVCCYPDVRGLLDTALARCGRVFAFSYPKRRWYIRAVAALGNGVRGLTGRPFRTFVHDERAMRAVAAAGGFRPQGRRETFVWRVEVWTRA
ncbi:MAG TPA: class I SAM-dependent methyltransferase [Vicinamibacterales bacterium]|nr:class I SAM-dependent methyltransferase [Vicinamibacterales bacterium]